MSKNVGTDARAKCPFYRKSIWQTKGQFIGVECEGLCDSLGFDVSFIMRLPTSEELTDYIELFCSDRYTECPYYQAMMGIKYKETAK